MARTETKSIFYCSSCGNEQSKWFGRCPVCQAWNTAQEVPRAPRARAASARQHWARDLPGGGPAEPVPLTVATIGQQLERRSTGFSEFDRVLGGGVVDGSVTLVGGDPGIGKSTLLLQTAVNLARGGAEVLYVSGEESERQIRARAERLEALEPDVLVLAETDVSRIAEQITARQPQLVVADSIQSLHLESVAAAPGSVGQVRECAFTLLRLAKASGVPVILVGHVTKEGDVAGPRVLEHMVDAVLYLEGERYQELRVLRAQKNRFGATTELGLFEMTERGFRDVPEPSSALLSDRRPGVPGSAVAATLDGSRALLIEVQALTVSTPQPTPQKRVTGLSPLRLAVLLGVLKVRGGIDTGGHDVFVSVTGGIRVDETGVDLAVCLAIASCMSDRGLPTDLVVIGEVGLGGEIRRVTGGERRLAEAAKIGLRRALVPASMAASLAGVAGVELLPVADLAQAIDVALAAAPAAMISSGRPARRTPQRSRQREATRSLTAG
jgi:DNA repair protein RadA/Sms